MTGQANGGSGAGTAPAPTGRIVLAFPPDQPTDPGIVVEHVTPGQVFLAAYLLDLIAHELRTAQLIRAGAAVPGAVPMPGQAELTRIVTDIMAGKRS